MATVSIDIPTNAVSRVNDAFAAIFGYNPSSGQTKAQFSKQQLINYIKQVVRNYEGEVAAKAARDTNATDVETNITLT